MEAAEKPRRARSQGARERREPCPELEREFEVIYKREYPVALRYARRSVDDDTAEDVVQSVFVRYWEGYTESKPLVFRTDAPEIVRASILKAVRNQLATRRDADKALRRNEARIREHTARTQHERTPSDLGLAGRDLSALLDEKLAGLPPQQREVFSLVKLDGLSYAEVAAILGVSTASVHQHLVKANTFLRRELAPYRIAEPKWWFPIDETLNDEADDHGE